MNTLTSKKIKSIKRVEVERTPVYDIEVPTYSNFALANGIVVHNSKDIADAVAASLYRSIDYKKLLEEYRKGEDVKVMLDTNTSQSPSSWVLGNGRTIIE